MIPRPGRRLGVAVLLGVAGYYAVLGGEYSAFDLRRLGAEREAGALRLQDLRAEVDSLERSAAALESNPDSIERVARERFGLIRDGETLYRFPEVSPTAGDDRKVARTP